MCGGSKGSSGYNQMGGQWGNLQPQQQVTTQASPQAIAAYTQALGLANQAIAKPYQQFGTKPEDFVAQLNAQQQAAQQGLAGQAAAGQPYYQAAPAMAAAAGMGNAAQMAGSYMNPFMQQVVSPVQQALQQQFGQQNAAQQAEAIKAGAFGGERAGLQRAALQGQQGLAMGQALSPLYQTGYGQALGAAQTDLQRQLAAAQGLSQEGLAAQQASLGAGTLGQQTQQAGISALQQQFQQQQMWPYMQAQFLAGIAGGLGPLLGQQSYQSRAVNPFGMFMSRGGSAESRMGGAVTESGDYARGGYSDGGDIGEIVKAQEEMYKGLGQSLDEKMPTGQIQASRPLEPAQFAPDQQQTSALDRATKLAGLAKDVYGIGKGAYDAVGGLSGLGSMLKTGLSFLPFALQEGGVVPHGYATDGSVKSKLQANQLYDYYVDELGAHPNEAKILTSAAGAESNYNPEAVHDQGTGYGLYGHRLDRLDAMRKASGEDQPSWQNQAKFTLNELRSRPEHALVMKENATPEDLTMAQMHFERPAGYKPGDPTAAPSYGSRLARTRGIMGGLNEPLAGVRPEDRSMVGLDTSDKYGLGEAKPKEDTIFTEENVVPALAGLGAALEGMVTSPTTGLGGALLRGAGAGLVGGAKTYQDIRKDQLAREIEKSKLGLQERGVNVEEQKANIALKELMRKQEEVKRISDVIAGKPTAPSTVEKPIAKSDALLMADKASSEAARYRQAASLATDAETQQKYMTLAQQADQQADKLRSGSPELKQQAAVSDIMSEEFKNVQKAGKDAPDNITMLNKMKTYLDDPSVYTGIGAEQYLNLKKAAQFLPWTRGLVDERGIADTEKFGAAAKKMVTDATGGSLGAGISNADVRFLESRSASLGTSKEANKEIIDQAIKVEDRKKQIAEFQRDYIDKHGSLDANYNSALAEWANAHPLFPEKTEKAEKTAPAGLPPKDQLKVGEIYDVGGRKGKWTGTGFVGVQ